MGLFRFNSIGPDQWAVLSLSEGRQVAEVALGKDGPVISTHRATTEDLAAVQAFVSDQKGVVARRRESRKPGADAGGKSQ